MDDLSTTRFFVATADAGSFSQAARNLGLAPSSVSRQISQLEAALGVRLFHRTTRRQSLTQAGEVYLRHARRAISDLDEAKAALAELADRPAGQLTVSAEADFAMTFIEPVLAEFFSLYPDVRLTLSLSPGLVDLVDAKIDLAIRIGQLRDSDYRARKIGAARSVICASPDYLKHHGAPATPYELTGHPCLSFNTGPAKTIWRFDGAEGPAEIPVSGPLNVGSLVFLRKAAIAGLGLIMAPRWIIEDDLKAGRLMEVLMGWSLSPGSTPIHALYASNRQMRPALRVFIDFLAEKLAVVDALGAG